MTGAAFPPGSGGGGSYWSPVTPPPRLQMIDSSVGQSVTQVWPGVRGHRELDTYWHLRGPTEILERSSASFKSERGATYLTLPFFSLFSFPLTLFGGFGPVFEKTKVLLRYQYIEETLVFHYFFFFP